MNITKQGLALIEMFEGVELKPYRDQAGHWTIGIGHLMVGEELQKQHPYWQGITEEQAFELLQQDLWDTTQQVKELIRVPVSDNQYTALVTFAFNVGTNALKRSMLLKKLNAGDYTGAAAQFIKWNKVTKDGKKVASTGLTRRRAAEELVFRSPVPIYQPNHVLWAGQPGAEAGTRFAQQHPDAVIVMIAPTVEETYGAGTEGAGEAGPSAEGERAG